MNAQMRRRIASAALIIGFFLLWEFLCRAFNISDHRGAEAEPDPRDAVAALPRALAAHGADALHHAGRLRLRHPDRHFARHAGRRRPGIAYDVAYPLLIGFASIPKVAVVPIFVLWFGAGAVPAILTAMIMSMFPIVVNVATGLATTEPELEDVMKTLRASKLDILWNVGLPRAMPYFFASLKVAVTLAFVGVVLSETVASNRGIGNVMMIASSSFDVPLVFAGLLILAVMGVSLYVDLLADRNADHRLGAPQGRVRDRAEWRVWCGLSKLSTR